MSSQVLEGDCREIVIIIHDGKGQRRYNVPHLLACDLETWLRWAEKHGNMRKESERCQLDLFGGGGA